MHFFRIYKNKSCILCFTNIGTAHITHTLTHLHKHHYLSTRTPPLYPAGEYTELHPWPHVTSWVNMSVRLLVYGVDLLAGVGSIHTHTLPVTSTFRMAGDWQDGMMWTGRKGKRVTSRQHITYIVGIVV